MNSYERWTWFEMTLALVVIATAALVFILKLKAGGR